MPKAISKCRICGNIHLQGIIDLGEQSLTGVFPKTRETKITSGPLELVKCIEEQGGDHCGLVQLRHSYDNAEMYGDNYGYRSSLNSSMVAHLKDVVEKALMQVSLKPGDLVIDIGSNDGTLLKNYSRDLLLIGIDPSATKFKQYYTDNIQLVTEFFSADVVLHNFGNKRAKLITSIAMFYDLEDPMAFISDIAATLDDQGVWVFEQSYMPLMLERVAYDTICHEHLEYYGLKQVQWMLQKNGLKIIDLELNDINGGSFKVTAAKLSSARQESKKVSEVLASEIKFGKPDLAPFREFESRVHEHKKELIRTVQNIKKENKLVIGYGASTKGNVILQYCGFTADDIPYIAEVNEDKFGAFTPGTLIPIISEKTAREMHPAYFLVLPWHFRDNIIGRERDFLAEGGKLLFPLPSIEIVGK